MPKKKTIPPPDDFSSEFMETESAKELSEQQVESAGSDNTETPLTEPSEGDLGSGDVSGTADVGENEPDAENTADAADTVPVSDEKAEDPEYKGYRVAIPLKEMMLYSGPVPYGAKYKPFMERMNSILATMLTAEIDFIVRGLDNTARSVVASRKAAMLRKRQTFYLDANEDGVPMIYEGRVVQARVIGVAEKVLRVEVFGVECTIFARDLSAAWFGDAREYYSVGDRVLVRVLTIDRSDINHISITADIRSVSSAANQSNLDKCVLQGKYAGRVTDVRHGVVFIRLNNGVNAVAHTCYDRRMPGKKDDVSFAVTRLDEERGIAVGIITRIIKQNL